MSVLKLSASVLLVFVILTCGMTAAQSGNAQSGNSAASSAPHGSDRSRSDRKLANSSRDAIKIAVQCDSLAESRKLLRFAEKRRNIVAVPMGDVALPTRKQDLLAMRERDRDVGEFRNARGERCWRRASADAFGRQGHQRGVPTLTGVGRGWVQPNLQEELRQVGGLAETNSTAMRADKSRHPHLRLISPSLSPRPTPSLSRFPRISAS